MTTGSRKYVLVADDDASILRFVTAVVEKEGLETTVASDGKAAYKVLKSDTNIVCAIFDVRMPYIEGPQLVKFMQADERLAKIPVIMMTGENELGTSYSTYSAGSVAFLPKPFTNHQLILLLRMFLGTDKTKLEDGNA